MIVLDLPHLRNAARVWINTFAVRDANGDPILASFARHDGAAFTVAFAMVRQPMVTDAEGQPVADEVLAHLPFGRGHARRRA